MTSIGAGRVISVNVGRPRTVMFHGEPITTAIWKTPVAGRLRVEGLNIAGDDQADRTVHGGADKAVYVYTSEDYAWWTRELGRPIAPGTFGDNLTTMDVDVNGAVIGERWLIGTTLFEVAQPRVPCFKLGIRMDDPSFPRRFSHAGRPGAYLRILREGEIGEGDGIEIEWRPTHGVSVEDVARIYYRDQHEAGRLTDVPRLPQGWRDWAVQRST